MNYFIVEDQSDSRELIQKYMHEDFPQLTEVGYSESYAIALEQIPKFHPDLLLLDINLGSHNAFELLDALKAKIDGNLGLIIFISAYDDSERILQAFEYFPLRYITKPIDRNKLQISIDQAIHQFNLIHSNNHDKIALRPFQMNKLRIPKIKGEIELIDQSQILFLQSTYEGQMTRIFLTNHTIPILGNKHIGYFKTLLADYKQFFAVSQSLIINLNFLKSYNHHSKIVNLYQWSDNLQVSRRGGEELKRWLCGE